MDWVADHLLRNVLGWDRVANVVAWIVTVVFFVNIGLSVWIVYSKGRRPNAALAWIATLFAIPILGLLAYIVIGENRVGLRRRRRHARIVRQLRD